MVENNALEPPARQPVKQYKNMILTLEKNMKHITELGYCWRSGRTKNRTTVRYNGIVVYFLGNIIIETLKCNNLNSSKKQVKISIQM